MSNNLYIASWYSKDDTEVLYGYVWADHFELDTEREEATFYDACENEICVIVGCNAVREAYLN